jgi:hypothetical protein
MKQKEKNIKCAIVKVVGVFGLCVLALMMLPTTAKAQRYIAGMTATEGRIGIVPQGGYTGNFGVSKYTKARNRWMADIDYLGRDYPYSDMIIPLRQFTINGGINYLLFSDAKKTFFTSFGWSASVGYELINDGKNVLPDGAVIMSENKFLIGGMLNLEMEYFVDDDKIIIGGVRQRAMMGSMVTPFQTQVFVGFKYVINRNK